MSWRAVNGFDLPRPHGETPSTVIHTDAYDRDAHLLPSLEPLTAREMKLFKMGGIEAVYEERRFHAREAGDPSWNTIGRRQVHEGLRPEAVSGRTAQEAQGREPVHVPVLLQANRPDGRAQGPEHGADTRPATATQGHEAVHGTTTQGTAGIREGAGPGAVQGGPSNRIEGPVSASTSPVSALREADHRGVAAVHGQAVATPEPPVRRRGRPRKHVDDGARRRAWRARRRGA